LQEKKEEEHLETQVNQKKGSADEEGADRKSYTSTPFMFGVVSGLIVLLLFPVSKMPQVRKLADLLRHPGEILLLLRFKFIYAKKMTLPNNLFGISLLLRKIDPRIEILRGCHIRTP